LGSTFFGQTSTNVKKNRLNLFTEIHEIVFHGQGGYDWETIYNMPTWLRRFTFNKIKEYYDKQNESTQKATAKNSVINPDGTVKGGFKSSNKPPSYK
jgi:hypothetical protein